MHDNDFCQRTQMLIGPQAMQKLADSQVAVFGLGGVGSYAAEALARCGVGRLHLIDGDAVNASNINRQLIATTASLGQNKAQAAKERIALINPQAQVRVSNCFFTAANADSFDFTSYDFVIDAIDSVPDKTELICRAQDSGTPIISSMGTGNKLDPQALTVADIYATDICPLARVMRQQLRRRGVAALPVVYSQEKPLKASRPPGSIAFVPGTAGLLLASYAVNYLIKDILS